MENNDWEKISVSFEQALLLSDSERDQYLSALAQSAGDAFASEVRTLLQADANSSEFLSGNAMQLTAQQMAANTTGIQAQEKFGNYRILEKLGAGGMGEVYLAEDETLGRRVALKFLPQIFMQDETARARFTQEARAISALNHPNILTVYEIDTANERAYIATEFVEGQTLREKIQAQKFSVQEVLQITQQIAEALQAAHSAGIIHRDIKPENIMVRPDGYVKVLDFGIATLGQLRNADLGLRKEEQAALSLPSVAENSQSAFRNPQLMGTPKYMSPEQTRGAALDARSDLWSVGVTMYEMLAGKALFAGASAEEILLTIRTQKNIALALPDEQKILLPILQKLLAPDIHNRYDNAQQLVVAIKRSRQSLANRLSVATKKSIVATACLFVIAAGFFAWRYSSNHLPVPQKLYWEMSAFQQTRFVQNTAQQLTAQLGANAAPLTSEQIETIKKFVDGYAAKRDSLATTPGKESIKTVYARASVYAPFIIEEFRARDLPPILGLYVAMNETEFHPCTQSAVGAKGLFSFMPVTAQRYGLQLKPEDERCDPRKIANAAARYFEDLTRLFGRDAGAMTLAMGAYNCGENCISERIHKLQSQKLPAANLWDFLTLKGRTVAALSDETSDYVPKFLAGAIIGENPQHFGLEIQPLSRYTAAK